MSDSDWSSSEEERNGLGPPEITPTTNGLDVSSSDDVPVRRAQPTSIPPLPEQQVSAFDAENL